MRTATLVSLAFGLIVSACGGDASIPSLGAADKSAGAASTTSPTSPAAPGSPGSPANGPDPGAAGACGSCTSSAAAPQGVCPAAASGKTIVVAAAGGDVKTIQAGVSAAAPGDTVLVRAGTYSESVSFSKSGSASGGCITLKGEAGAILDAAGKGEVGIGIDDKSYIRVAGMTVRNVKGGGTPIGISVRGGASFIELRGNLVHGVESSSNAHGIAFYGDSATPMSNLLIDDNEIKNCKLGQSESMVLNGNVTKFVVSRNRVHDNDNIGIDFIGFEGTGPAGSDQAREGVCVDNVVYNISSASNATYGGERAADGIYVDGGRDIVIERNRVDNSDIGIEIASEHQSKVTSNIVVRNNFVSRSYQGNVMIGGYASNKGKAQNIAVLNNTLYQGGDGEVVLQYNSTAITIKNNVCVAKAGNEYLVSSGGNNTNVTAESNLFFGASTTSAGAFPDARAKFGNPMLVSPPTDLHLQAGSPAIDAGIDLGNDSAGKPLCGALDVDGAARVGGGRVDIGADER